MISILSSRGLGIVPVLFAVVMNMTLLRSNEISRKLSVKLQFCSGSRTSSRAAAGSPLKSFPILSISSMSRTGLLVPAAFIFCIILPGRAPTYVLLCPRISASSRIPPSDMFTNFLPIVFAIDLPREVFPTPGGPTKQSTCALMLSAASFLTARNSRIRSFTSSRP
ncbi:hypothetical protein SDC9_134877 [bioreactor metagenome]|uniref:Uncharacterized protein n=1 Tax=bioreactor metagenome TaxID=1076179 RepID=A0A645DES9_9ZZZZ